jgi:hypothetical protein
MSTVQDAFSAFYGQYQENYAPNLRQQKVAESIMDCRTEAMGSHAYICDACGHIEVRHNSCRDRHCPNCQATSGIAWVESRMDDILDAPYFHVVLTLPSELHMLVYHNQKKLYDLMYKASAEAVMKLAKDPKYLGAQPGFLSILHTWGDNLTYHPHIHMVFVAGGLTENNQWRVGNKKFLLPVRVLGKMFRGIFMDHLKQMYRTQSLNLEGLAETTEKKFFYNLVDACFKKRWYVYIRRPFDGPVAVLKYLARYTHRVAISNDRIISVGNGCVVFKPKHADEDGRRKPIILSGVEFIRRFLMHVLPKGFVKIRYYGILGNRNRKTKLVLCKKLTRNLASTVSFAYFVKNTMSKIDILINLAKRDFTVCPCCGQGKMRFFGDAPKPVRSP